MKSLRNLISGSALILMAGLLVFSALVYVASDSLLHRFVDGRLLELAETLAELIDRHPDILDNTDKGAASSASTSPGKKEQRELYGVIHSLRVFSPNGRLMWKSPNAPAQPSVPA
ncbi:MAG: hypothetical protein OEY28_00610, partial [Nitrospira sp.]|nr:hypothetical protein [Nitrospira sp.]